MSPEDVRAKGATARGKRQVDLEAVFRTYLPTTSIKGEYANTETKWKGEKGKSGSGLQTQIAARVGGFVNPDWKGWFVGLPIGWTAIERLATSSFRRWRLTLSRDLRSKLVSDGLSISKRGRRIDG